MSSPHRFLVTKLGLSFTPSVFLLLSLALVGPAVAQTCIPPPNNLVSWWPGEGNANDIVGSNNGIPNDISYALGKVGQAFSLNGQTSFISVPDSPSLHLTQAITIEAWVYVTDFAAHKGLNMQVLQKDGTTFEHAYAMPVLGPLGYYHGANSAGLRPYQFGLELTLDTTSGKVWTADVVPGGGIWSNTVLTPAGEWHHLATTYDGILHTAAVYLDGNAVASYSNIIPGTIETSTAPVHIGNYLQSGGNTDDFNGLIDEVRLYNRALTATEIQAIYTAGGAGVCKASVLTCQGFEPPMDVYPVTVKGKNRALPLKAQLFDANGALVTNTSITAAPVLQVLYNSGTSSAPVDVTSSALPAGQGTDGNQFVFTDDLKWQFNLQTTNYTAPGTYTISIVSGDNAEYSIEPACVTSFERK